MTDATRRTFLAGLTATVAGCSEGGASGPTGSESGNSQGTPTPEPSTVDAFANALDEKEIRVDDTMTLAGGVSVMYYRDPERHAEQVRTVALTFVNHRRIVDPDSLLSFTALSSNTDRHGEGYISREWADRRASGELGKSEYVQKVADTYRTV